MGKLNVIGNLIRTKFEKAGDSFLTVLAQDPDMAEAQIRTMQDNCDELARRVAEEKFEAEEANKKVQAIQIELDKNSRAADILAGQIESATANNEPAKVRELEGKLAPIVSAMERLTGDLAEAKRIAAEENQDVAEWSADHERQVSELMNARNALAEARRDMERSAEIARREADRKAKLQRDAGIRTGISAGNVALDAMRNAAAENRKQAEADRLTAESLKRVKTTGSEDIVEEVLKGEAATKPVSALERLRALRSAAPTA